MKKPKKYGIKAASRAAINLGIRTASEYNRRYNEDPRLPSNVWRTYSDGFPGWASFLGNNKLRPRVRLPIGRQVDYDTAIKVNKRLGLITKVKYMAARRNKNLRLPANPAKVYATEWKSWGDFLSTGRNRRLKSQLYNTLAEASAAAKKLHAHNSTSYREIWRDDPRLPRNPSEVYSKEWRGWNKFLE